MIALYCWLTGMLFAIIVFGFLCARYPNLEDSDKELMLLVVVFWPLAVVALLFWGLFSIGWKIGGGK